MGSEFTFYEYVDSGGRSVVGPWLRDDVPAKVRANFHKWMLNLEEWPIDRWSMPYTRHVGDGLFELRVQDEDGQQYRILYAHTKNRKPTLLHGFFKPDEKLPPGDKRIAARRRADLFANLAERQVEYRYD